MNNNTPKNESEVALAAGVDWQASKEAWISDARSIWEPRLLGDSRFPDGAKLIKRFDADVNTWRVRRAFGDSFRPVIQIGNELAAAVALLDRLKPTDTLRYEFPISGTRKTHDFLVLSEDGRRGWIDVKTIAPQWQDDDAAWQRFQAIAAAFPENARLVVDRNWGGAGISSQEIKARWSFIARTIEVENKSSLIPATEQGPVWLLFCSDGSAWHSDDLEDFADFYRSGSFREDDWARNAVARYMEEDGHKFAGTLAGFHYLSRRHDEIKAQLQLAVRGPNFFAP